MTCQSGTCQCPSGQNLCSGTCTNPETDSSNCGGCGNICSGGQICSGGSCQCPSGQDLCSGKCINPTTDSNNCGGCGNICDTGFECRDGKCPTLVASGSGCFYALGLPTYLQAPDFPTALTKCISLCNALSGCAFFFLSTYTIASDYTCWTSTSAYDPAFLDCNLPETFGAYIVYTV